MDKRGSIDPWNWGTNGYWVTGELSQVNRSTFHGYWPLNITNRGEPESEGLSTYGLEVIGEIILRDWLDSMPARKVFGRLDQSTTDRISHRFVRIWFCEETRYVIIIWIVNRLNWVYTEPDSIWKFIDYPLFVLLYSHIIPCQTRVLLANTQVISVEIQWLTITMSSGFRSWKKRAGILSSKVSQFFFRFQEREKLI